MSDLVNAYCDASLHSNPGRGAVSVIIESGFSTTYELDREVTLNQAEHLCVLLTIRVALDLGIARLRVHTDSQLVVRHLSGKYRVLSPAMIQCVEDTREAAKALEAFECVWVPRTENKRADALAGCARRRTTNGDS